jgi:hypothetical protein
VPPFFERQATAASKHIQRCAPGGANAEATAHGWCWFPPRVELRHRTATGQFRPPGRYSNSLASKRFGSRKHRSIVPNFLVERADPQGNNVRPGFVLREEFVCPNCGRVVHIASTANSPECMENIKQARNAVTLQCPNHDTPTPVPCGR